MLDTCAASLVSDVISYGVCPLPFHASPYSVSTECEFGEIDNATIIEKGTCKDKTERLIMERECLVNIYEQQEFIRDTLLYLIWSSCRYDDNPARYAPVEIFVQPKDNTTKPIRTKLNFENTRNRYPWVCSLRRKGSSGTHRCAVNLLSIPPEPTIFVGAAHCTFVCKDGLREVDTCCCVKHYH